MEENPAIEQLVADQILQRGARMKMRAPAVLRMIGIRTIALTVRSPYEGTMMRVSAYYLSTGLKMADLEEVTYEQALSIWAAHGKAINKAVACAWLNGYWAGKLFTKPLAWYMRWHATPQEILTVAQLLLIYGGTSDFLDTTRSVRMMKTTSPTLAKKETNEGS